MFEFTGEELIGLPVRLHGIELGRPVDVLLDRDTMRTVGLDVLCGDEAHRFLPLTTAAIAEEELTIYSPLVLLEEHEVDFYRSRAFALSTLRARPVTKRGEEIGRLRDIVLDRSGELLAVILDGPERIPFDGTLGFAPRRRTAA